MGDFLEGLDPNGDGKYSRPHSPHKSPECVDLCGIGGVGGLIDPHRVLPTSLKKKGTSLAFSHCRVKTVRGRTGHLPYTSCYTVITTRTDPSGMRPV
jgi:hypothetical protein